LVNAKANADICLKDSGGSCSIVEMSDTSNILLPQSSLVF